MHSGPALTLLCLTDEGLDLLVSIFDLVRSDPFFALLIALFWGTLLTTLWMAT